MTDKKEKPKKRKDPRIEEEYFEEVELTDPSTGKITKHTVKITRYRAVGAKLVGNKGVLEDHEEEL